MLETIKNFFTKSKTFDTKRTVLIKRAPDNSVIIYENDYAKNLVLYKAAEDKKDFSFVEPLSEDEKYFLPAMRWKDGKIVYDLDIAKRVLRIRLKDDALNLNEVSAIEDLIKLKLKNNG